MKKNLLTICLSLISLLVVAQKNDKGLITTKIQEFKNHLYLSTSKDPLALMKAKTIKMKELEANELVAKMTPKSRLKSGEVEGAYIDTTHTYPWNAETQDWDTIPIMRIIKSYDEHHNLEHYVDYKLNDQTEWEANIQYDYNYNEANQLVDVLQQSWQYDVNYVYNWVNIEHYAYEYNELGQKSRFHYQYWDMNNQIWVDMYKNDYTYDTNGNNISVIETDWDPNSGTWYQLFKYQNKFDNKTNSENIIHYLDPESNEWLEVARTLYSYDLKGNNNEILDQYINLETNSWDNVQKKELYYDDYNQLDSFIIQYYDPYSSIFIDSEKGIYKYSGVNNIAIVGYSFDPYSDSWILRWQYLYGYNDVNEQISYSIMYRDSNTNSWYFGAQTKSLNIGTDTNNINVALKTFEIYPNPASEWIYIQSYNSIINLEVCNLIGRKIISKSKLEMSNYHLDISSLKSGFYVLKIQDIDGKMTTKIFAKN